jgi:hypothetical protein
MKKTLRGWVRAFGGAAVVVTSLAAIGCSSSDSPANAEPSASADSLYVRLGSHAGITMAVSAIVTEELKDPEIASYFYYQTLPGGPAAGHPSAAQIEACFVNLLGQAAGGSEQYPGGPADNAGFQCRGMTAAHASLGIPSKVFDKFIMIAGGVLKAAKVSDADITTVANVLTGQKSAVAQDTTRDDGAFVPPK